MTVELRLHTNSPATWREVLGAVPEPFGLVERHLEGGRRALVFHERETSTTGSVLVEDVGALSLRLPLFASDEDVLRGLGLVEQVAGVFDIDVELGHRGLAAGRLRDAWLDEGIAEAKSREETRLLAGVRDDPKALVMVEGWRRPVYLGARTLEAEVAGGPPEGLYDRLMARIRSVQTVDETRYHAPAPVGFRLPDGSMSTMAPWPKNVACLLPPSECFMLRRSEEAPPVMLRHEHLEELAGEGLVWLDEVQALVDAIPEAAWETFVDRAQAISAKAAH
jgi:hypothetical protein